MVIARRTSTGAQSAGSSGAIEESRLDVGCSSRNRSGVSNSRASRPTRMETPSRGKSVGPHVCAIDSPPGSTTATPPSRTKAPISSHDAGETRSGRARMTTSTPKSARRSQDAGSMSRTRMPVFTPSPGINARAIQREPGTFSRSAPSSDVLRPTTATSMSRRTSTTANALFPTRRTSSSIETAISHRRRPLSSPSFRGTTWNSTVDSD